TFLGAAAVTVANPTVNPATIPEGSSTALSGTFTDPDTQATHSVRIAWGDGGSDTLSLAAGVSTYGPASPTYQDNRPGNAPFTITVTVTSSGNLSGTNSSAMVTVTNVPPTPRIGGLPAGNTSPEGTTLTLTATATDPSPIDTQAGFTFAWTVTKN